MTLEKFISKLEKGGYYNIDIIPVENYTGMFKVYFDGKKHYKSFDDYKKAKSFCNEVNGILTTYNGYTGKYTPYFYFDVH